jgi:hypothetical protein
MPRPTKRSTFRTIIQVDVVLDFASIAANSFGNLAPIKIRGVSPGDVVILGLPDLAVAGNNGIIFQAWVPVAGSVQIQAYNVTTGAVDPPSQTFRICVLKL